MKTYVLLVLFLYSVPNMVMGIEKLKNNKMYLLPHRILPVVGDTLHFFASKTYFVYFFHFNIFEIGIHLIIIGMSQFN